MLTRIAAASTLIVAACAGALAAVATHDVALASGAVSDPTLAWLLPLIIEGGAVTSGLLAWVRTRNGERAWRERCALMVLVLLAMVVNASHVTGDQALGVVLAAAPPLVLVTSLELLLSAHRPAEARTAQAHTRPVRTPAQGASDRDHEPSEPELSAAQVATPEDAPSRAEILERLLRAHGDALKGPTVARELGVSDAHGRRLLAQARKEMAA